MNNHEQLLEGYERYRQFMDRLTEINVDDYNIDLPKIAVMGDTSSGKSSLLSSISLVDLPSADCLTTRCPIMLKMHNATSRSASVKVSLKDKVGAASEFAERKIGEHNWSDITRAIADAQAFIIEISGKEVSRDIVSVDVYGPQCENLTLIDLPGIVRTAGKQESATLADDIQGLMNYYLKNTRCVILAVLPSNVDFHNSQILADARKVDPGTNRTIPVLTKPDLIDDGGQMSVRDVLLGLKTHSFSLGFHMVKCRGQAALNRDESIEQGLVAEQSFFDNTEPWRGLPDKSLLGTKNLRVKLAELQMNIIRSSFKDIKLEMKVKRDKAALAYQELGNLPSNLSEKRFLFQRIKEEISNGISSITLGGRICSTQNDRKMRPSAKFQLNANSYQTSLNSSKLANISEVVVGSKVIVLDGECEVRGEVVFINDNDDVFIKHVVANNIKKPGELCTMTDGSVYTSANSIPVDGPATTPYAFGSTNNDSPAFSFGASDPLSVTPSPFTAPINPFAVDGAFTAVGTTLAPYRTTTRQTADSTTPIVLQTITAMPQYEEKSLEELRLEDYMVKSKSKRASSEKRRIRRSAKPLFEAASASGGGSGISIERSSSYAGFPPMISAAPTNTFATKASSGGGWFGSAPDSAPLENRLTVGIQSFKRTLVRPDPEWISDFIKWNRPYKLPIFIDPDVFNAIVVNLIEKEWVKPGTDLLESTSELMGIIAEEFILEAKLIASFHLFKSFLTAKASKVVEDLTIEARQRIEEFVTREKVPYTQNHYIFENLCKLRTQRLMDEVLSALPAGEEDVEVDPITLAAAVTNIFKRNQERSVDDHMAEEMQHALNSYGKVAMKRFIDAVPMICVEILQKFPDRMNAALLDVTDNEIERIVVAPQNIISKRDSLKKEIDTLEKGLVALRGDLI